MTTPAPLFRDPIFDGAADPTMIWNREERAWWLLYTNRRATAEGPGVSWVHGTDIGIASSVDGSAWTYRGVLSGLEFERGRNTFWAPEVLWHAGLYHMYVSYVPGVPDTWRGTRRTSLQAAQLELDGETLICRRDQAFALALEPGE